MSSSVRKYFRLRSRVAAGITRQPGASDMLELEWDEELARLAQAHADQCKFRFIFWKYFCLRKYIFCSFCFQTRLCGLQKSS